MKGKRYHVSHRPAGIGVRSKAVRAVTVAVTNLRISKRSSKMKVLAYSFVPEYILQPRNNSFRGLNPEVLEELKQNTIYNNVLN